MFAKPHLLKGFRIKSARVEYFKKGVIYNLVYINFVTIFFLIFIFLGTGDTITQQFGSLLHLKAKDELAFCPMNQRPDKFLHGSISGSYNELWSFS